MSCLLYYYSVKVLIYCYYCVYVYSKYGPDEIFWHGLINKELNLNKCIIFNTIKYVININFK